MKRSINEIDEVTPSYNSKRRTHTQRAQFEDIPNDLLILIFSYLKYPLLLRDLSLVNKHISQLINGELDGNKIHSDDDQSCCSSSQNVLDEDCIELWNTICESQTMVLPNANEFTIDRMICRIVTLKIKSVDINTRAEDVALKYLTAMEPFVDELCYQGPFLVIPNLTFPKLTKLDCQCLDQDQVNAMFCNGNRSRFVGIYVEDVSTDPMNGFDHLETIEMNSIENVFQLSSIIENNRSTLKELWLNAEELLEDNLTPVLKAILKCSNMKIIEFGNGNFTSVGMGNMVIFNHLTFVNFRGTTSFISQFFSVDHPNLRTVIIGVSDMDGGDLTELKLANISSLSLYIWVEAFETFPITDLMSCVNPDLKNFRLFSLSPIISGLGTFSTLKKLADVHFHGNNAYAMAEPIITNCAETIESIMITECDSVGFEVFKRAKQLQSFTTDSRLESNEVHDLYYALHHHENLKTICLGPSYHFFKVCMGIRQENTIITGMRQLRKIEAGQNKSRPTDLFVLLPSSIEQAEIIMRNETTLEEWLLVTVCCHLVSAQVGFRYQSFPLREILPGSAILSFSTQFMRALKYKLVAALENPKLAVTQEEKEKIRNDYEYVFSSNAVFESERYRYPALSALYLCACEQFIRNYAQVQDDLIFT